MSADEETPYPSHQPAQTAGIRLSDLPASVRSSALNLVAELDADGDGFLDEGELATALNILQTSRNQNRSLTKIICGLLCSTLLLVGAVFGTSIAAANLSKDTNVDRHGRLNGKSTNSVVQTSEAVMWSADKNIVGMTNRELVHLKSIALFDGDLHFQVKGFARPPSPKAGAEKVVLLVEGGMITYDKDGMADASGDALSLMSIAFGVNSSKFLSLSFLASDNDAGRRLDDNHDYNACRRLAANVGSIHRKMCGSGGGPSLTLDPPTSPPVTSPNPPATASSTPPPPSPSPSVSWPLVSSTFGFGECHQQTGVDDICFGRKVKVLLVILI